MSLDLAAAETQMAREATGLHDWHYRDLPNLSPEFFDEFVSLVGEDNLRWLTLAERQWPSGSTTKRGQVMISPEGMEGIAAHNAASGTEAGTGETEGLDPKGDGPTLEEGDAQTPSPSSRERK